MNATALKSDHGVSARIVQGITDSREAVSEMLSERTARVGRYLKHTGRAAEDLIQDTARHIKRAPFGSVALAFGAGALLGVVLFRIGKR